MTLRRYPTLDELAGSVPNPPGVAGLSWEEIRTRAWTPQSAEIEDVMTFDENMRPLPTVRCVVPG